MHPDITTPGSVDATVVDVLSSVGIAYLDGDDGRHWTVTRSTQGPGLHTLAPGARLRLTLSRYECHEFAQGYQLVERL